MASVIHATAHGMSAGSSFRFADVLPTNSGVSETATYFVLASGLTANDFQFSTTPGGSAFTLTNAITSGSIVTSAGYTSASGTMAPPTSIPTPSNPTVSSDIVSGIVRLTVVLNGSPEAKVRAWEVQVTSKYTDESVVSTSLTGTASTDTLTTAAAHGLVADDLVRFTALTGGSGLVVGQDYYVIASGLTSTNFKVSLTQGGAAFDFTTDVTAGTVAKVVTPYAVWTNSRLLTLPVPQTTVSMPALGSTVYAVRVRAVDVYGLYSSYSGIVEHTTLAGSDSLTAALSAITNGVDGQVIDFDNIVDGAIRANHIEAGAVNASALAATLVLTSLLTTSLTGRRVEIDGQGVRLLDASNEVVVNIPTDANTPVFFKGDIVANSLTAKLTNDLSGTVGLTGNGIMTLANGVQAPTVAPGITASVDFLTLGSTPSGTPTGIGYDSGAGTFWLAADPASGYVAHEYNATTGAFVRSIASTGSTTTQTATLGATSHISDTWQSKQGSTDSHIATPLTIPSGLVNVKITKVSVYMAGTNGDCATRCGVWDTSGNNLGESSTFQATSHATGVGNSDQYNKSLTTPASVSAGQTVWAGFRRTNTSDYSQWDRDDGSGKTTKSADGTGADGTGWATLNSASKPNVYITYTHDVDTRLETAPMIGVCTDGTYVYTLDDLGKVWKYNRSTGAYVANSAVQTAITGTKTKAGLFYDATATELIVTTTTGTGAGVYPKFVRIDPSTLAVSSTVYSASAGTTFSGTTDTFRGGARLNDPLNGNAATYWVATTSAVYAYTFSGTTATQTSDRHFGQATTSGDGLTYDGTQFRGYDSASPTKVWKFTAWDWTTASALYWVCYAWYDSNATGGTHETAVGPRASLTLRRRERLLVTNTAIPVGGSDDPDKVRVYMLPNASAPSPGSFKRQAEDALTSRYLTTYDSAGGADGAGTAFPSGSPAEIRSALATGSGGWSMKGDGSFTGLSPTVTVYSTGSGSWTKPTNLHHIVVEVVGGGGGGGGVTASSTSGHASTGAGGGGGGYVRKLYLASALGSTESYAVGAGGTGGTGADGAAGGTSSFGSGGTLIQATGGSGGVRGSDRTATTVENAGGAAGTGSGGDINTRGTTGPWGYTVIGGAGMTGGGGSSALGGGAPHVRTNSISTAYVGADAVGIGGGGSGSGTRESATNVKGGDGANGIVVVTAYFAP